MTLVVPVIAERVWVCFFLVLTLALLLGGGYARIERLGHTVEDLGNVYSPTVETKTASNTNRVGPMITSPTSGT